MQMHSRNALRWVISAILLFPLPYNGALQCFKKTKHFRLKGFVMIGMCPRFPVHYLALLRSQKPQVLMAMFHTLPMPTSNTPLWQFGSNCSCTCTVYVSASWCWKALVKPDVPIKTSFCHGEWEAVSDGETRIYYINEAWQKGGCYMNGRIIGWLQWVNSVVQDSCIN